MANKREMTSWTVRLLKSDFLKWKAAAARNELSLCEYVRRRVNERPLKATKPRYADQYQADRAELLAEAEMIEALRLSDERNARYQRQQERRQEADRQVAKAGSVAAWFRTAGVREEWGDLEGVLLQAEKRKREDDAEWQRYQEQKGSEEAILRGLGDYGVYLDGPAKTAPPPPKRAEPLAPQPVASEIIIGPAAWGLGDVDPFAARKQRIVSRDDLRRPETKGGGDGPAGFD